jgi:methyl-accepting chemotaxis protein
LARLSLAKKKTPRIRQRKAKGKKTQKNPMGGCISDAVGGEVLKALKKDVKDLRAALDAAKDALLAVANSINDKVAEVKHMEEAAAAEVNAVKEQLTTKVDGVKKVADDITTKVESVAAKVHELVPHQ